MANLQVGVAGNGTVTVGAGASVHSPANNTLTLGTNNSERARIDSSGRLILGNNASESVYGIEHQFQIEGTNGATSSASFTRNSNNANPPYLTLAKSRGTSLGSETIVQADDQLGVISFNGADGTNKDHMGAQIQAYVDGTPGANDMPGRLVFATTADGTNSSTERIRVYSDGCVGIGTMGANSRKDGHLQVETETTGRYAASFSNHHASGSKGIRVQACDSDESNWIILAENRDGTNRFGVRGTGNVEVHDGNLVIGTSGHGIDFSATSDATGATSELLDDYEEGTFTPTLTGGSTAGSPTYQHQAGWYTKIGNLVTVSVNLATTNIGGGSGNMRIGALPFTCASNTEGIGAVQYNQLGSGLPSGREGPGFAIIQNPNTYCDIRVNDSGSTQYTHMEIQTVSYMRVTIQYTTA